MTQAPLSWPALSSGCPGRPAPGTQAADPAPSSPEHLFLTTVLAQRGLHLPPPRNPLSRGSFCLSARIGHSRVSPQLHMGIRDHAQIEDGRALCTPLPFANHSEFPGRSVRVRGMASTLGRCSRSGLPFPEILTKGSKEFHCCVTSDCKNLEVIYMPVNKRLICINYTSV